jgi:hypothetical protein
VSVETRRSLDRRSGIPEREGGVSTTEGKKILTTGDSWHPVAFEADEVEDLFRVAVQEASGREAGPGGPGDADGAAASE